METVAGALGGRGEGNDIIPFFGGSACGGRGGGARRVCVYCADVMDDEGVCFLSG